jgi:predicted Rossmann fold nucleotide-binding protein DprA/Smf involved in DNA uptake
MNMTLNSKIAALAAVIAFVAAPALAGDQNTATELQDSGRYVAQVTAPSGAYASARKAARVQAPATQPQVDFQLVGHN